MHQARIVAEHALLHRDEAQPLVEAMCSGIRHEWIDQDRDNVGVCKTTIQGQRHHLGAVSAAQVGGRADPDVNGALVALDVAPVVRDLDGGIDDLHNADSPAVQLRDQRLLERVAAFHLGPPIDVVIVARRGDDMGLGVPVFEERYVVGRRGSKANHAAMLGRGMPGQSHTWHIE